MRAEGFALASICRLLIARREVGDTQSSTESNKPTCSPKRVHSASKSSMKEIVSLKCNFHGRLAEGHRNRGCFSALRSDFRKAKRNSLPNTIALKLSFFFETFLSLSESAPRRTLYNSGYY